MSSEVLLSVAMADTTFEAEFIILGITTSEKKFDKQVSYSVQDTVHGANLIQPHQEIKGLTIYFGRRIWEENN